MKKYRSISIFCHYLVRPPEIFFLHHPLSSCLIAPRVWLNISSTSSTIDLLLQRTCLSYGDIKEISRIAHLLSIEIRELHHDKTNASLEVISSTESVIDVTVKRNDENSESVIEIDVMESLIKIFDHESRPAKLLKMHRYRNIKGKLHPNFFRPYPPY